MVKFRQYLLLLWKNYVLQKRRPISTAFEIILPTLFILLLAAIKANPEFKEETECSNVADPECSWSAFKPTDSVGQSLLEKWLNINMTNVSVLLETPPIGKQKWIAFTPNSILTQTIMNTTKEILANSTGVPDIIEVEGYDDESDMINYLVELNNKESNHRSDKFDFFNYSMYLGAVVFQLPSNATTLPPNIEYQIRLNSRPRLCSLDTSDNSGVNTDPSLACTWLTKIVFPLYPLQKPRDPLWDDGGQPGYHRESFSALQWAIDKSLVANITGVIPHGYPTVYIQRFPYFEYNYDRFANVIQNALPLLLVLAYIFTALTIVKELVQEKEKRLKESMKMMGLANWVHWAAWFTRCFLFLLITVIIITLIFAFGKVLPRSDLSLIFVYLILYAICTISFCFCVSVFFSRAVWGAAGGGIGWLLTYFPYYFLFQNYGSLSLAEKLGPSLLVNTNMAFGAQLIGSFEGSGVGVQWSNIYDPPTVDDNLTFSMILSMFVIDSILYGLITWYIEAVFPGKYGIPLKFYFPFQLSYWCGHRRSSCHQGHMDEAFPLFKGIRSGEFEVEPEGLVAGIQIRDILKVFNKGSTNEKVAVDGVSLNMFEGQISALLGHNGAGKTTLMSILTGLFPATSGTAYVNGCDIGSNISGVRESLGLCPQHDVLFDTLTVSEHLWFFGRLKGCRGTQINQEVNRMLQALQMEDRKEFKTRSLSGGMKRKLSVGIALVAGSKVVMLDEPTSGMDPSARRATWDLLFQQKEGRTILLTTHHMDEADLLGDRIAIMANGQIRCCGSSLFLKSKYGVGYHMVIVKDPHCNTKAVKDVILSYIPTASVESEHASELSYILPREMSSHFEQLFSELETKQKDLGVGSFGVSVTTMEEVFLKVGEQYDPTDNTENSSYGSDLHSSMMSVENDEIASNPTENGKSPLLDSSVNRPRKNHRNVGFHLALQQFYAMLVKRFRTSTRYKMAVITQLLLPITFTLVGLILAKTQPGPGDSPPRVLTSSQFKDNYALLHETDDSSFSEPVGCHAGNLSNAYFDQFIGSRTTPVNVSGDANMTDYVRKQGKSVGFSFNNDYLIAGSFETDSDGNTKATAWFNNQAFHAIEVALTSIDNAIMSCYSNGRYTINVTNYPLPRTIQQISDDLNTESIGFNVASTLLFGMAFLASSFVRPVVEERSSKAKHIQFVSGVSPFSYWMSSFVWDMINYFIPCIVILILFAAFQIPAYVGGTRLGIVILQLFLYGWSIIPLMYLLAFAFNKPSTAFILLTLFNIVTGQVAIVVVYILKFPQVDLMSVARALEWAFLFLPNYCLGQSLIDIYVNYEAIKQCTVSDNIRSSCEQRGLDYQSNYMAWGSGGCGRYATFMAIEGLLVMILVLMIEGHVLERLWYAVRGRRAPSGVSDGQSAEDSDVARERARIDELMTSAPAQLVGNDVILINNLGKVYGGMACCGNKTVHAVCGISLGVQHTECFGLLGVNGAGKTTTFGILTGDLLATYGTAIMDSFDIRTSMNQVRQRIGYCPQFDALINLLTGRELLTMFARLRGVPEKVIPSAVDTLIHTLLLTPYADRLCGTYSGGNKRKLCTAICLVGDPPIVFLDEPTTGMDPAARRQLWDVLNSIRADGRCIVITSHRQDKTDRFYFSLVACVN
jgi:ATP-binding cassette subfamily A (ABC1) protein 3